MNSFSLTLAWLCSLLRVSGTHAACSNQQEVEEGNQDLFLEHHCLSLETRLTLRFVFHPSKSPLVRSQRRRENELILLLRMKVADLVTQNITVKDASEVWPQHSLQLEN